MKLSVLMITYNHEPYIEQAVRGALAQQTDFAYEIVIGEDRSTDRTRERLLGLAEEHPGRLRLLFRDTNLGMGRNFADTYAACRGECVALLEGDDYWTDPHKLAKQVAFLDANPTYAGCAHVVRHEGGSDDGTTFPSPCPGDVTFDDFLRTNPIPTCSVVYRRQFDRVPDWHAGLVPGDWPLHLMHAAHGPFRVLPDVMGVYRVHAGGIWSTRSEPERIAITVRMFETLRDNFHPEHRPAFDASIVTYRFWRCWSLARAGLSARAAVELANLVAERGARGRIGWVQLAALRLRLRSPEVYDLLTRVGSFVRAAVHRIAGRN